MLALVVTLLAGAFPQSEGIPPTRYPNEVTSPANATRTNGPGWVCFEDYGVALTAGETAYADYIGFHSVGWRVVGPRGQIVVTESEAWAVPHEQGQVVPDARGRRIVSYSAHGGIHYMIWGVIGSAGPEPRPAILVEGAGLTGSGADYAFLQRIEPRPRPADCRHRLLRIAHG
jgi:hypothetical protein